MWFFKGLYEQSESIIQQNGKEDKIDLTKHAEVRKANLYLIQAVKLLSTMFKRSIWKQNKIIVLYS